MYLLDNVYKARRAIHSRVCTGKLASCWILAVTRHSRCKLDTQSNPAGLNTYLRDKLGRYRQNYCSNRADNGKNSNPAHQSKSCLGSLCIHYQAKGCSFASTAPFGNHDIPDTCYRIHLILHLQRSNQQRGTFRLVYKCSGMSQAATYANFRTEHMQSRL